MEKSKDTSLFAAPGAAGRGLPWLARAFAIAGAIVCSGLAGPGTARAAGPGGIDVSAEVEAALAEVDAVVAQAPAREGQSVTVSVAGATTVTIPAPPAAEAVRSEVAAATTQPVATTAPASISTTSASPGSMPATPTTFPAGPSDPIPLLESCRAPHSRAALRAQ